MSATPTGADAMKDLKPCPFCGAGTTQVVENGKVWMGMKYSEPASVSVRHWCEPVEGQPARMIERVGRDHESANAAWNRRPQVEAQPAAVAGEAQKRHGLCGKCMTPHICAEDGPGCKSESAAPAAPSVGPTKDLRDAMWLDPECAHAGACQSLKFKAASPAAPAGVPTGFKLLKDTTHDERSWPEDVTHENGAYNCVCCVCLRIFIGHKRRVICRVCKEAGSVHPSAAGAGNAGARNAE